MTDSCDFVPSYIFLMIFFFNVLKKWRHIEQFKGSEQVNVPLKLFQLSFANFYKNSDFPYDLRKSYFHAGLLYIIVVILS